MKIIYLIIFLLISACGSEQEFDEEVYFKPVLKCLTIDGETCETGTDELIGASDNDAEEDF